jgi:hypothetical protein
MDLVRVAITLCVIGVVLWLANTYIPMEATMKRILNAVVIVGVVLWLLLALFGPLPHIYVGR